MVLICWPVSRWPGLTSVTGGQLEVEKLCTIFIDFLVSASMQRRGDRNNSISVEMETDGFLTANHTPPAWTVWMSWYCDILAHWNSPQKKYPFFSLNRKVQWGMLNIPIAVLGALVCPCYLHLDFKIEAEVKWRIWEVLCKMGLCIAKSLLARKTKEERFVGSALLHWLFKRKSLIPGISVQM